jgi:type VI secretion system protein ImpJ
MFLRPHHFQTAQRHWFHLAHQGDKWDLHYNWGLRAIDLDLDALANSRLVVRGLKARLRDGTLVTVPEDGALPVVDLKGAFERETALAVLLAVPVVNLGKSNAAQNGAEGARYLVDTQELEDENTGINPQPVQVRLLNLKLLLSTHDQTGYEVLPIARIERSASAEGTPQLDRTYIPPLLSCDAWQPLQDDILESVYDRIGKKLDLLAGMVLSRGITFGSHGQGDPEIFNQLRVLNEAYALQGVQIFAEGIHPLPIYLEMCRLVGQLSIFGDTMRPPELPKYDHDDLGTCFSRIKQYLDWLLTFVKEPEYKKRDFVGNGLQMRVSIDSDWLQTTWQMFVGVQSSLGTDDCIRLLTGQGRTGPSLDMKIGSSEHVDELFKRGVTGLKFAYSPAPPRMLPSAQGLAYFLVNRESQQQEWERVQKSFTLAIRLNENLIMGDIENQRVLKIKNGNQIVPMQFGLYLVAKEK